MEYLKEKFEKCEEILQNPRKFKKTNILECMKRMMMAYGSDYNNLERLKTSYLFEPTGTKVSNLFNPLQFEIYVSILKQNYPDTDRLNKYLVKLIQGYIKMYIEFLNTQNKKVTMDHLEAFVEDLGEEFTKALDEYNQRSIAYYYDECFYRALIQNPIVKEYAKIIRDVLKTPEKIKTDDIILCLNVYLSALLVEIHDKELCSWDDSPNIVNSYLFKKIPFTVKEIEKLKNDPNFDNIDLRKLSKKEKPPVFNESIRYNFYKKIKENEGDIQGQYELMLDFLTKYISILRLKKNDRGFILNHMYFFILDLHQRHRYLYDIIQNGEIDEEKQEVPEFELSATSVDLNPYERIQYLLQLTDEIKDEEEEIRERHKYEMQTRKLTRDEILQFSEERNELTQRAALIAEELEELHQFMEGAQNLSLLQDQ